MKIRRQRMHSGGAGQKRFEVNGRGLRPAVNLDKLMIMTIYETPAKRRAD